jgi:hypothetical protein
LELYLTDFQDGLKDIYVQKLDWEKVNPKEIKEYDIDMILAADVVRISPFKGKDL